MILKNAKSKGSGGSKSFTTASTVTSNRSASGGAHGDGKNSSTSKSRGHRGSGAGGATGSSYGYHGSKKGILQSAAELTRRSKRASSRSKRHGKSKGRSSRSIPFVKGQKAFYRSAKCISKVTVVGVHHDAKLEPYYTIKLKDGKEKQTDGKHLSPVQVAVKKSSSSSSSNNRGGEGNSYGKQQQHQSVAAVVPEVVTDHMTESSSEAEEIIIEEVDGKGENEEPRTARGGVSVHRNPGDDAHVVEDERNEAFSSTDNEEEEDDCVQRFSVHQYAYYRPPAGSVTKVRILSYGEDSKYPTRYAVSSSDGSRTDKVRASHLATLMDLTSKELSMLMKERNKRHDIPGKRSGIDSNLRRHQLSKSTGYDDVDDDDARGRHHQLSESTSHDDDDSGGQHHQLRKSTGHDEEGDAAVDNAVIDEGYMAEKEGGPASNASEQSLSHHHHRVDTGAVEMALEDTTSKEKEILALPPPKTVIKMVEAKTEEGGTKMVPMYEAGMHVRYKNAAGIQPAEILGAHLDDLMEPYYSIRLEDGREKQTDNAHILMEAGNDDEDEKQEEFGEEAREEVVSQAEEVKVKEEPPKEEGVVYNEQNEKKPHSNSFSSNQQQRKSLAEQMQNVQHLPDPALDRTSVSPKKRRDDYSQDPLASSTNKRNPTTLAITSLTPTLDRTSTATKFDTGDKVIYNTSEGEQLRAVIVSSHSDKKNRPYYVVRLKKGRKKQVYGHRLQPYVMSDQDGLRKTRSRSREVSRDQTKTRGRSSSKVSKSSRGHSKNPHGRRPSESVDSHKSSESTSSNLWRRSRSPHEKIYRREESSNRGRRRRDESLSSSVRERYATEPAPQQKARRSSRQGGSRGRSQSTTRRSKSFISVSSENYHHGESSRGEGRQSRYGRERSRSRAPSSEESTSQRSHSHNHQFSSAHHHHVITSSGRSSSRSSGRSSHPAIGVSMANRASSGEVAGGSVDGGGDGEENLHQPKGRSISRLRSFRKSFANRMNKN